MAEQSASLPVTPKLTKSLPGNSRRHSTGKASSLGSDGKNQLHHMRSSTGSCHDFCKYGTKHAFEDKARHPFLRKNSRKPAQKPSSNFKTLPDTLEITKRQAPKKPVDRKSPALKVVTTESVDSQNSVSSKDMPEKRRTTLRERDKTSVVNLKSSTDSETRSSAKFMKSGVSSPEKLEVSLKQALPKMNEEKISSESANYLKVTSPSPDSSEISTVRGNSDSMITQERSISKTTIKRVQTSQKAFFSPKTSGSGIAKIVASPRTTLSLKPTVRVQMSGRVSQFHKPSISSLPRLNEMRKTGSDAAALLQNQSKIERVNNDHLKVQSSNPEESIKEIKGPGSEGIQEKTLYVIKMDNENKCLESDRKENGFTKSPPLPPPPSLPLPPPPSLPPPPPPPPPPPLISGRSSSFPESPSLSSNEEEDEEKSESTASDIEDYCSEYDEVESTEEPNTVERVQKGWNRKAGMMPSQDKIDQPVKLRFRRGKVIEIKPEHNGPRRLKFRRGRVLGEHQIAKADSRKCFKKRGATDIKNDDHQSAEKVVLRHQDVCERKDDTVLLNNVIEETANKLVEARKSKVKALVGAFETVISLQDTNRP